MRQDRQCKIMVKKGRINKLLLTMRTAISAIPKLSSRSESAMYLPTFFSVCTLLLGLASRQAVDGVDVITYKGNSPVPLELECKKLKLASDTGCVCLNGLWRFYRGCSSHFTVAGNDYCFITREYPANYGMELISDPETLVMVREKKKEVVGVDDIPLTPIDNSDVFITASPHTIKGPLGTVCLYPQAGAYCSYQPQAFTGRPIDVAKDCEEDFPFTKPLRCDFIKAPQSCEEAENAYDAKVFKKVLAKLKKGNETTNIDDILARIHDYDSHHDDNVHKNHVRKKRAGKMKAGRTFIGLAGQNFERTLENTADDDEDYIPPEIIANITEGQQDEVLTEVWNYVETTAEVEMNLRKKSAGQSDYGIPFFALLQLSKKVMKKFCPESYVPAKFFDIAVQSFIQIQVKRFAYDSPNANYPAYLRIVSALEKCIEGTTVFPFITPDSEMAVEMNMTCDPNGTDNGLFFAYNQAMEMNVTEGLVGWRRDPIIETAYKVFLTTESVCFPYFNASSHNDHHRFITWMTQLFTNDIQDVWLKGSSNQYTYGQFLGNLQKVIAKVAYCAAASRTSTNLMIEYPWELSMPFKDGTAPPTRKKRDLHIPTTDCLIDKEATECFSKSKNPPFFYIS